MGSAFAGLDKDWQVLASRVAPTDCPVLLTGETGSGKGFAARWIHERSRRAARPFVPVNCGAIPDALIDSHLFGHARGAFSGADRDHSGLVRAADGGTLLLDEIADLPLSAQSRLLRLLEEREAQPVGYNQPVRVNVRVIAATSADLWERVRTGGFRPDLLFRLDVVHVRLPALRDRREEIRTLAQQFNAEFAKLYGQHELRFEAAAMRVIVRYDWPGNVRELRAVIERLHVLCGGVAARDYRRAGEREGHTISVRDLEDYGQLRAVERRNGESAAARMIELKIHAVNQALEACDGNMSRAAANLGVHRSTLYRWLTNRQRLPAQATLRASLPREATSE